MLEIALIAHNIRSAHNVGSLLRTAEGLGVEAVYLTGYTPYPRMVNDARLPHLAVKIDRQVTKTSLGAEKMLKWHWQEDIGPVLEKLRHEGYMVGALEQSKKAIKLPNFKPTEKIALIVGREVEGLEPEILSGVDKILEIPMLGQKESFNVASAAAMALYHLRYP